MTPLPTSVPRLLIDGHAHCQRCYDPSAFLAAAIRNLHQAGEGMPTLLMTESSGINFFQSWKQGEGPWSAESIPAEPESIVLNNTLLVIAGRQIVTKERVEVLAALTDELFADGLPLDETLDRVLSGKGIAILPWGVGKWVGSRYALVKSAMNRPNVFLGDNAGRVVGWPRPTLFATRTTLAGTDPLRLPSEIAMVGTYGFALEGPIDLYRPAQSIRAALHAPKVRLRTFGRRVGPIRFLRQQIGLRMTKK